MHADTRKARPHPRCFNEAGAFEPRKWAKCHVICTMRSKGFNEAGAFEPRKWLYGLRLMAPKSGLQ